MVHGIAADEGMVVLVGGLHNEPERHVEVVAAVGWHMAQSTADSLSGGLYGGHGRHGRGPCACSPGRLSARLERPRNLRSADPWKTLIELRIASTTSGRPLRRFISFVFRQ